jgi:multiple antibiotic resistance protein
MDAIRGVEMDLGLSIGLADYVRGVGGVLAIVNPLSTVPILLSLSREYSNEEYRRTILAAAASVFVILVVSYWIGNEVLAFFSISVNSFRIAGGILIFMTALSMLEARTARTKQTEQEVHETRQKENIAVVPLAIPLTAGPGAISLMIIISGQTETLGDDLAVVVAAFLVSMVAATVWMIGKTIAAALGQTGMNIITRIMGLLLAAIAVEFIVTGLSAHFPNWL